MKKFLLFTVIVLMITGTAFATGSAIAIGADNPASQTMPVQVLLPKIVFIHVDNASHQVTFDFSTMTNYPDTTSAYPWWYLPTDPASPNVNVWVWTNDNDGYTLTTKGDQDFADELPLTDLYYAGAGETKTANGSDAAGGNWTAFSTYDQTIAEVYAKTDGFKSYNQDYELKIDGDENAGTFNTVTITYTITGK